MSVLRVVDFVSSTNLIPVDRQSVWSASQIVTEILTRFVSPMSDVGIWKKSRNIVTAMNDVSVLTLFRFCDPWFSRRCCAPV